MKTIHNSRKAHKRSAFTLLELLIVISIIAILAGIAIPTTALVMNQARKAQARAQVNSLVAAVKQYETTYGVLPLGDNAGESAMETDAILIDILSGRDETENPKEIPFLEGKVAKLPKGNRPARNGFVDEGGGSQRLVDPWGNAYVVIMDADDDNRIQVPGVENPISSKVIAWSYGKPESDADYQTARKNEVRDWLTSWK